MFTVDKNGFTQKNDSRVALQTNFFMHSRVYL